MKKSIRKKAPSPPSNPGILREVSEEKEDNAAKEEDKTPRRKYSSDESSEEEDTRELEGNVYTKAGMEVIRIQESSTGVSRPIDYQFENWIFKYKFLDFEEKRRELKTFETRDRSRSGTRG